MSVAQLTLDVGDLLGIELLTGSYKIGGDLPCAKELMKGSNVHVVVSDDDGEIVSSTYARVTAIALVDHEKDGLKWTERAHRIRCV